MSIYTTFDLSDKKINFSGHGTFPFRFTWLSKGVQNVIRYPDLFLRDDAIVILGVGKNMVGSIRYWCETLELIESPARGHFLPTQLGYSLLSDSGWDPLLEHPATLWLLQWQLTSRLEKATTWYLVFSRWSAPSFTKDQLQKWIISSSENISSSKVSPNSLKRDIDVFIRTYVPSRKNTKFLEDSFDCPLVELGLITEIDDDIFELTRNSRPSLPNEVFLYSLLEYWQRNFPKQNSLSFEAIQYGPGSPGRVFNLTENSTYERIQSLPDWSGIQLNTTVGMSTVFRSQSNTMGSMDVLQNYYVKEN